MEVVFCLMYQLIDACIIGATKCGTTSFASALSKHRDINFSRVKEPTYFWPDARKFSGSADFSWVRNIPNNDEEYLELFGNESGLKVEASAYISNPNALRNLYQLNPELKLILILRDPVDRAVSAFRHLKRDGFEPLGFQDALIMEKKRIQSWWGPLYWYRSLSDYLPQIEFLLNQFDRSNIHFILFEKLLENPDLEFRKVQEFLDVEYCRLELPRENIGRSLKKNRMVYFITQVLTYTRSVSRRVLPPSFSSFIGKKALTLTNKHFTEKLIVDITERELLFDLYHDIVKIEELTLLPCREYWKNEIYSGS